MSTSPVLPIYSVIITVWAIIMLEYWKREESKTALRWGMTDFEQLEPVRPEYHGHLIKSYIDGDDMLFYPPAKFYSFIRVSRSIVFALILLVLGITASIYYMRFSIQPSVGGSGASTIASVANTVQIIVMNLVYTRIAIHLTDQENYRTDTEYEDALIVKLFIFQFVNSYASFFYIAFVASYLPSPDGTPSNYLGQCGAPNCMTPLSLNLAILFGTRLTLTNAMDIIIPYIMYILKVRTETEGIPKDMELSPAEKDYMLMQYDGKIQGILGYADFAVQFGFSLLFITALPIATFISLICTYFKLKFEMWKFSSVRSKLLLSLSL